MVFYHTVVQVYKIRQDKKPKYLYDKITRDNHTKGTRFATGLGIQSTLAKSELKNNSFVPRGIRNWNEIPERLRRINKLKTFKVELRKWTTLNKVN